MLVVCGDSDLACAQFREYVLQNRFDIPTILDRDGAFRQRFRVQQTPTALVFDGEGRLVDEPFISR